MLLWIMIKSNKRAIMLKIICQGQLYSYTYLLYVYKLLYELAALCGSAPCVLQTTLSHDISTMVQTAHHKVLWLAVCDSPVWELCPTPSLPKNNIFIPPSPRSKVNMTITEAELSTCCCPLKSDDTHNNLS